jgi:hypothetical protein
MEGVEYVVLLNKDWQYKFEILMEFSCRARSELEKLSITRSQFANVCPTWLPT